MRCEYAVHSIGGVGDRIPQCRTWYHAFMGSAHAEDVPMLMVTWDGKIHVQKVANALNTRSVKSTQKSQGLNVLN